MSSQEQKKILNHKNGCDPINSEIYWAFENLAGKIYTYWCAVIYDMKPVIANQ